MKPTYRFSAVATLVLIVCGTALIGCARNEQELQSGITSIFDTAAVPFKVLLRQFDDISDGNN
ncbi:hypothetical protein KDK77_01005 [bacterium]|nr:hypothetical protein [bacterium]